MRLAPSFLAILSSFLKMIADKSIIVTEINFRSLGSLSNAFDFRE
jgi:hypothetical protein